MAASAEKLPVLIAGAGPVGLIAALGLAQRGVPVIVLEAEAGLYQDPRAATTHPATLEMLDDLGLLAEVERQGLVCRHFRFWDRVTGDMVANFDLDLLRGDCRFPYVIQCEQFKTASIAYQALAALPGTEVRFSHRVTGVSQTADGLTVTVETPDGPAEIAGAYLIGADGGRSEVRKALAIEFEGFTYPEHFLVLTSPFDFAAHRDLVYRNYFFDPIEWCNLFKVAALGPPGLWRAVFPADPGRADADVLGDANAQATPTPRRRSSAFSPRTGATRSSTAIFTRSTSASPPPSAPCWPATQRTSTIPSAAWGSTAASTTPSTWRKS